MGNILSAEQRVIDTVFTESPFCGQLVLVMLGGVMWGEGEEGRGGRQQGPVLSGQPTVSQHRAAILVRD